MTGRVRPSLAPAVVSLLLGCGATSQDYVELPAAGAGVDQTSVAAGDWEVSLETARVGFGPVYFCATRSASTDLCPVAVVELAASAEIDALDPAPQEIGLLEGVTGTVRSAIYDLGISWLLPGSRPTANDGAPGGHSVILEGIATRGADELRFVAEVDVTPLLEGTYAFRGQHTDIEITGSGDALLVRIDPFPWIASVDFDALFALGEDPVEIAPDTPAYSSLVTSMTSAHPPEFEWNP